MASQNKVILVGVIEEGPDVKATNAGDPVSRFKLCVDRPQRQDGMQSGQDHIPIVAWQRAAEATNGFSQGDTVLVEGNVQTRNYDDPNGFKIYVTEVNAREVRRLSQGQGFQAPIQDASIIQEGQSSPAPAPVMSEPTFPQAPAEPVLEPMEEKTEAKADGVSFDFNDHSNKEIIENAPAFDKPIEDDVPF
ncbi:hypothetical protein DID80_04605 [Candidatus Marinamargulisbacteria bacterium SCGC AAA071-K20]|nr:hypothetical protein DID80_04605 [Candidatus Marinamargulisbacteria bacterium SCGC AAA071-K20]